MSKKYFPLLIILTVLLIGSSLFVLSQENSTENKSMEVPEKTIVELEGLSVLILNRSDSNEEGIATISEISGKAQVIVKLTNSSSGLKSASLNSGTCQNPGEEKFILKNVVSGESETRLEVNMLELSQLFPLVLLIKEDITGTVVSCGLVISS